MQNSNSSSLGQQPNSNSTVEDCVEVRHHNAKPLVSGSYCGICNSRIGLIFVNTLKCVLCKKCREDYLESGCLAHKLNKEVYPVL